MKFRPRSFDNNEFVICSAKLQPTPPIHTQTSTHSQFKPFPLPWFLHMPHPHPHAYLHPTPNLNPDPTLPTPHSQSNPDPNPLGGINTFLILTLDHEKKKSLSAVLLKLAISAYTTNPPSTHRSPPHSQFKPWPLPSGRDTTLLNSHLRSWSSDPDPVITKNSLSAVLLMVISAYTLARGVSMWDTLTLPTCNKKQRVSPSAFQSLLEVNWWRELVS